MLTTMSEVTGVTKIINGVDNANLMSVDSTEPYKTEVDKVDEKDDTELSVDRTEPLQSEVKKEKKEEAAKVEIEAEEKVDVDAEVKEKEKEEKEIPVVAEKVPVSVERRIGKITKKWRSAERAAEYEKNKRKEVETELAKLRLTIPTTAKPAAEDFEDTTEYIEALTDWKIEQKLNAQKLNTDKEAKEIVEKDTANTAETELDAITEDGRDKYDDYDKLVFDENLVITQNMYDIVITSDIAADVLYFLGKNPEKALALSDMSTIKIAKEIGKIELEIEKSTPKLNTASEGEIVNVEKPTPVIKKKVTKAPAPIEPVKADGVVEKDPASMSMKEYRAWRNQK
jgi:hypothetical protein